MASPHVAGVIALMKAVYPDLSPDILDGLITAGSITEDLQRDGATVRNNSFGYGLIDALKAVQIANQLANGNGNDVPSVLSISPNSLNFENFLTEITITASKSGNQAMSIENISIDAPWLQIAPIAIDANGLGSYRARVNRTGLADGLFTTSVSFTTSAADTIILPVTMIVGTLGEGVDQLGQLWVVLINTTTNTTFKSLPINSDSNYQFTFTEIPSGSYEIIAGTDADNDGFICDAGEACGAYPTFDQRVAITVSNKSVTSLNFLAGFDLVLNANNNTAFAGRSYIIK
jgi:serine protease